MNTMYLLLMLSTYGNMTPIPYPYATEAACETAGETADDDSGRIEGFVCIAVQQPWR